MENSRNLHDKRSTTTIDPEGDVVLEFDKERLLVSSKVLSLASPVFAPMLKGPFKEGIKPKLTSNEPSAISLPGDDADAFILLCNIVHFRSEVIPQKLDISCLEKITIICDKYQCTGAVTSYSILWIQSLIRAASSKDLNKLLLVCYTLNLSESFSVISWEILLQHPGSFADLPGLTDHPLVRHDLLGG